MEAEVSAASVVVAQRESGSVLTVHVPSTDSAEQRDALLTETVFAVIEYLAQADARKDEVAVVDVRLQDTVPDAALPAVLAFVEAARGIVQAFVLETALTGPTTNVLVTSEGQTAARERTLDYLFSADGRYSRGATYDLRRNP
jgi:hypothetical protein